MTLTADTHVAQSVGTVAARPDVSSPTRSILYPSHYHPPREQWICEYLDIVIKSSTGDDGQTCMRHLPLTKHITTDDELS